MLIAERLLLLLAGADTGRQAGRATHAHALSAALVCDLAVAGAVSYDESSGSLHAAEAPRDPALLPAYDLVRERPLPLPMVVTRLARQPVKESLAARIATHLPDRVSAALVPVLLEGQEPDEQTAALITLLAALEMAGRVVDHPDHTARTVDARAQAIADSEWGSAPVRAVARAAAEAAVRPPGRAALGAALGG